jgi:hypothetical protein
MCKQQKGRSMKKLLPFLSIFLTFVFAEHQNDRKYYLLDKVDNLHKKLFNASELNRKDELGKEFSNTAPICRAYINALNEHSTNETIEGFVEAPMHPQSFDFGYPKWELVDYFSEYRKDIALRIFGYWENRNFYNLRYYRFVTDIEKRYNLRMEQMYYTKIDIDNDGNIDQIIKIDKGKYAAKPNFYNTHLVIFNGKDYKNNLWNIDRYLSGKLPDDDAFVYGIFSYKNKNYIKKIAYDYSKQEFFYLIIKEFNSDFELVNLCLITAQ